MQNGATVGEGTQIFAHPVFRIIRWLNELTQVKNAKKRKARPRNHWTLRHKEHHRQGMVASGIGRAAAAA
jgi:hypothetical protein